MTVRFFVLNGHYRSSTDFTDAALEAAGRGYERLIGAVSLVRQRLSSQGAEDKAREDTFLPVIEQHQARFLAAMDDDLNTPQAMAALFDLNRAVNTLLNSGEAIDRATLVAIDTAYRTLGGDILGLIPDDLPQETDAGLDSALMSILVDLRAEARKKRDWATSDTIRDRLSEIGVTLEDRPEGTTWRLDK
jgi:cysteinyl-tRNA synthetase